MYVNMISTKQVRRYQMSNHKLSKCVLYVV